MAVSNSTTRIGLAPNIGNGVSPMPLKRQIAANKTCQAATKAGRQCAAPVVRWENDWLFTVANRWPARQECGLRPESMAVGPQNQFPVRRQLSSVHPIYDCFLVNIPEQRLSILKRAEHELSKDIPVKPQGHQRTLINTHERPITNAWKLTRRSAGRFNHRAVSCSPRASPFWLLQGERTT